MKRNPYSRDTRETARTAQQNASTPATVAPGNVSETSGAAGGAVDGSGAWQPYGLLDLTTFSEGFRLS